MKKIRHIALTDEQDAILVTLATQHGLDCVSYLRFLVMQAAKPLLAEQQAAAVAVAKAQAKAQAKLESAANKAQAKVAASREKHRAWRIERGLPLHINLPFYADYDPQEVDRGPAIGHINPAGDRVYNAGIAPRTKIVLSYEHLRETKLNPQDAPRELLSTVDFLEDGESIVIGHEYPDGTKRFIKGYDAESPHTK